MFLFGFLSAKNVNFCFLAGGTNSSSSDHMAMVSSAVGWMYSATVKKWSGGEVYPAAVSK